MKFRLDLPGVVITDANASRNYVRFAEAPKELSIVNRELTFADDLTDDNPLQYCRKKSTVNGVMRLGGVRT